MEANANGTSVEERAKDEEKVQRDLSQLTMEDECDRPSCGQYLVHSGVDSGVNTDPDWEDRVKTVMEYGSKLTEDLNALRLKQQNNELEFNKRRTELEKNKEQAVKQHQAVLGKLESVRVKLQLNNSKTTRKNFQSKKQEMISERSHVQEERDRLSRELEEADSRLVSLEQEQQEEQRSWKQDLSELKEQMEGLQREAHEAQSQAQRDELRAVEKQRDTALERIKAWSTQVSLYLNGLRVEFPHRYRQERAQWEKKEAVVRKAQAEIQTRFNQVLQQLQEGKGLENVPRITVPTLPHVPMSELYFSRMMQITPCPQAPPPPISRPRPPLHYPHPRHFPPPPPHHTGFHRFPPPPAASQIAQTSSPPPLSQTPTPQHIQAPPPQHAQDPPPAAGKLDKILDKLSSHFPQCTRVQLTRLLQQVKSDRGTLAGLSSDEVVEQVGQRLGQQQQQQQRGANNTTPGPIQRPAAAPSAPRLKPCLVCQRQVEPGAQFMLSCNHTVHTECIQVWLQSSQSHACPFCPSK